MAGQRRSFTRLSLAACRDRWSLWARNGLTRQSTARHGYLDVFSPLGWSPPTSSVKARQVEGDHGSRRCPRPAGHPLVAPRIIARGGGETCWRALRVGGEKASRLSTDSLLSTPGRRGSLVTSLVAHRCFGWPCVVVLWRAPPTASLFFCGASSAKQADAVG